MSIQVSIPIPDHDERAKTCFTHLVMGGSNFRMTTSTASLRDSQCSSIPITQDKSNYWFPVRAIIPFYCSFYRYGTLLAFIFPVCDRIVRALLELKPSRWANGSFSSLNGGAVMYVLPSFPHLALIHCFLPAVGYLGYCLIQARDVLTLVLDYLFPDKPGTTTAFPDDVSFFYRPISFLCSPGLTLAP